MTESELDHDMQVLDIVARVLQHRLSDMTNEQRQINAVRIRNARIILRRHELGTLGDAGGHHACSD